MSAIGKTALVIGASSGIGRALAKALSQRGYRMGLVARRGDLLAELQTELLMPSCSRVIDVSHADDAAIGLRDLVSDLQDVELFVVCAGTGRINPSLVWGPERETIAVNVSGFTACVTVAFEHLTKRGGGHLVGISSIAALRGGADATAYRVSKAYVSNYLEGVRQKFRRARIPVIVTTVEPGFVATAMAQGDGLFWVASPDAAARQIVSAIGKKRAHVYVTRRWRVVAWLIKLAPSWLYDRL